MTEHFKPLPGERYLHFKGHLVEVVGIFKDSEMPQQLRVDYIHLDTGEPWSRPAEMWFQKVVWPDGVERTRFVKQVPKEGECPTLEEIKRAVDHEMAKPVPKFVARCPNCGLNLS
jgi:hypothetical protein